MVAMRLLDGMTVRFCDVACLRDEEALSDGLLRLGDAASGRGRALVADGRLRVSARARSSSDCDGGGACCVSLGRATTVRCDAVSSLALV